MKNKYFMIPFLALLASSCQDEEQASIQPATGEEVQFGVALEAGSRTIYGEEANGAFPIYWVNGDQVVISSPECASSGYPSATYQVSVDKATQNYASSLNKTGEIGVRWGDSETADFYSVYPASHATVGSKYNTVTLTMPAQQDNDYDRTTMKVQPDMNACFMYAAVNDVTNGSIVNLAYKPISTALRFIVQGPTSGETSINYIRIFAPEGTYINGTFSADLSNLDKYGLPTLTPIRGLNYITFNVADEEGTYLTLSNGQSIEVNAFLLLTGETEITEDWYIEIGTTAGISFRKNLDALPSSNRTLVPGKIHRIEGMLPALEDTSDDWDAINWMANLQRNVYLSEISIPGSWNSLNHDYQEGYSIEAQYNYGVRAFHLDTRWKAQWVSDFGLLGHWEMTDVLGVADGGTTHDINGGKCTDDSALSFADALKQITNKVEDDEYMVVICTFAQGSTQNNKYDWRQAISDACDNNEKVINASTLTQNTVVGDVLGHVIVMVNTYTTGEVANSKCLFYNMGMTLDQGKFTSQPYYQVPLQSDNITNTGITIYGTHAQITTDKDSYNDDERGYVPSLSDRQDKVQNILDWSSDNYNNLANYAHDAWMYIGLGGYIPASWALDQDDVSTVASKLNMWMNDIVTSMETNDSYYPVGIVFMNQTYDYSFAVNKILQMNNKYRKAYDPARSPIDGAYINGSGSKVQSAAPGYSSGMTDNHTDAIGWTRSR